MNIIDMRSDTVTRPTALMRKAMADAEVGDDVYRDDPTVILLEEKAAAAAGKEAALFVPSGTMGNQLAVMTHTSRGNEIITEDRSHITIYEVGASAILSGVQIRTVRGSNGVMTGSDVDRAVRGDNIHFPETGLLCLENALSNGNVMTLEEMADLYAAAKRHNLPVHLDGARIFNAAHALSCEGSQIASFSDSVMFCLSKGLSAPIGSVLAGERSFVERARKNRKLLGGGMRQAGIIAAAGIVALDSMRNRLADDHANAKKIAERIGDLPGVSVREENLKINMVFFNLDHSDVQTEELADLLFEKGIKISSPTGSLFRLVTHREVTEDDAEKVCCAFEEILG